jgi:hypothetical protein
MSLSSSPASPSISGVSGDHGSIFGEERGSICWFNVACPYAFDTDNWAAGGIGEHVQGYDEQHACARLNRLFSAL